MKISKIAVARTTSILVAISALATIAGDSLLFSGQPFFEQFWESQDSEWISTHSLIVAMLLLYIAWSLWQRSRNAWRIVTILTFIEIFRSAFLLGNQFVTLTYGALFIVLLVSRKAFDKQHTTIIFRKRLTRVAFAIFATAVVVSAVSLSYHYYQTKQLDKDALSANKIIVKTLLLDQSTDINNTKVTKLFNDLLFVTGIVMYTWILSALFLPTLLDQLLHHEPDSSKAIVELLNKYSKDSEDSLKVWPNDKLYWSSATIDAVVAYKQQGKFAFALADPICDPIHLSTVIQEFNTFCQTHGVTASWILIDHSKQDYYESAGLSMINIGGSAMVSLEKFCTKTVNEKWWRWIRNKSKKQGLSYEVLGSPLSQEDIKQLAAVSDNWVQTNRHTERTFAVGYFDSSFLQKCIIHTLIDDKGTIVAFANQLPSYNNASCVTIDLMRSLPESKGAMALLLSELMIHLYKQGTYTYFDLGFVPLSNKHKDDDSTAQTLVRKAVKPVFSIEGLEQFKNKFEPEWHAKYIAWDGDKLIVPHMTAALLRALSK